MKIVYKITYPNGKIYVGKDVTNSINYFGSASSELIAKDFSDDEREKFVVVREILWRSQIASLQEVGAIERQFIRELHSNDPSVGYNRSPKWNPS